MQPLSCLTRVPRKTSCFINQSLLGLLLLSMLYFGGSRASGQSTETAGAIAHRSPHDFEILVAMEPEPVVGLSTTLPNSAKKKDKHNKIPEKYDVSRIGERHVDQGLNMYSADQERAMGKEMSEEIESHSKIVEDPVINEYIRELGQRLARNSDAKTDFTIKVIDSDEVNAFALPGGYFYVNTGLILAAQNESELAAVMAHEIAHVAARHATRNMTKVQIWNIASMPLLFFGGPVGMALRQVSGLALPMSINKFSRDAEREADLLGIEYEYAAGYDPLSFVNFFERLNIREKSKASIVAKAFATHPMNHDRIQRAQKEIATMLPARDEYIVDTSRFGEIHARLLRLSGEEPVLIRHKSRSDGPVLRRHTTDNVPLPPDDPGTPRN